VEQYIGVAISVIGSIIAIAVAWGWNAARVDEAARWRAEMEKKLEVVIANMVTREHCMLRHTYLEQTVSEIKVDIKTIKELLQEIIKEAAKH